MSKLEELRVNASVQGILPNCLVSVVSVQWFGSEALELTYKDPAGKVANELLYRHDEPRIEIVAHGRLWSVDGDGLEKARPCDRTTVLPDRAVVLAASAAHFDGACV